GAGQDLPDGPGRGGGRGQHLRRREPVRGRHRPAPGGGLDQPRTLRAAGGGGEADPRARDHAWRHHPARLPVTGWAAGVFRAGAASVWAGGRALPGVRAEDSREPAWWKGYGVVWRVSEVAESPGLPGGDRFKLIVALPLAKQRAIAQVLDSVLAAHQ